MKECAFTIVAKNYIGLGKILCNSLQEHNQEIDFRIFVADEITEDFEEIPQEVLVAKTVLEGISPEQWVDMTFKYDLTEFCTSIKPFCFEYIFSMGYDKAYYFDPDIYIFSSIAEISKALENHSVALTPQIVGIHEHYTGEHPEWAMNVNGIFNLGFCGIRKDEWGLRIIKWWKERLRDQAFTDRSVGQFTDQKWMDWLPAFLGERLCVMQSLGMNLAPWNYFERKIYVDDNKGAIYVMFRTDDVQQRKDRLVFVHFAGYDYAKLRQGIVSRKRIEDLKEYEDMESVNNAYRDAIVANASLFDKFIGKTYSYADYDNGTHIASFHRRLYHGLQPSPANPFGTGKGSFYEQLHKKGMIISEKIDGISRKNIGGLESKKKVLSYLYQGIFRIVGYKRYVMFLKSLYFYCRPEMHTFIINRQKIEK